MYSFIVKLIKKMQYADCMMEHMNRIHYTNYYVHGPKDRLFLSDTNSLANTLFNTRSGSIHVGKHVLFSHNVMVLTGEHELQDDCAPTLTNAHRDVHISDNVWIASGAIIIGPVSIGRNSIIGAGSVVVKDIPDNVLAVGNPAKVVRKRDKI